MTECEPRRSFSRRLSSTRTGSEPCKRVMISSTSEPALVMTPPPPPPPAAAALLGFLVRAFKEADDVSFGDGSASQLLLTWTIDDIRDPVPPCSFNSSLKERKKEMERYREREVWGIWYLFVFGVYIGVGLRGGLGGFKFCYSETVRV